MSFIVRGIDMPKDDEMITLQILSSGAVYSNGKMICEASAIEIPTPHGRLIDKDKLRYELFVNFNGERIPFYDCDDSPAKIAYRDLHSILAEQKTVIEAEGSETDA